MKFFTNKALLLFLALITIASATIQFEIEYKTDAFRLKENAIKQMVTNALDLENSSYNKALVQVYSKNDGAENYFYVSLYRPNIYAFYTYRLNFTNNKVTKIIEDYIEEDPEFADYCGTCPDPELEVAFGYITQFQSALRPVANVKKALESAGIKYVAYKDRQETKQAIKNVLTCPKLKLYGRIGHGSQSGAIQPGGGGNLTSSEISKMDVKDKYFPFNCCYVGGNKFATSVISAGGIFFTAGDNVVLGAGSSEPAWAKFMTAICKDKKEVIGSFKSILIPAKDRWGYKAIGKGPYFVFPATHITQQAFNSSTSGFEVFTNANFITFIGGPANISVFGMSGKLLHQANSYTPQYIWNYNTISGNSLHSGSYIAVFNNGKNNVSQKPFSISK